MTDDDRKRMREAAHQIMSVPDMDPRSACVAIQATLLLEMLDALDAADAAKATGADLALLKSILRDIEP